MGRGRGREANVTPGLKALRLAVNIKVATRKKPKNVLQPLPKVRKSYERALETTLERKIMQFSGGVGGRLEVNQQTL